MIRAVHLVCSDARQRAPKGLTADGKLLEGGKRDRAVAVSLAAELDVGDQRFQVCHVLALGQQARLAGEGLWCLLLGNTPSPMSSPVLHQTAPALSHRLPLSSALLRYRRDFSHPLDPRARRGLAGK